MSSQAILSVHDFEGIETYLEAKVPRPWWKPWLRNIDRVPEDSSVPGPNGVPIPIGKAAQALRSLTFSVRVVYAARLWVEARGGGRRLDGFGRVLYVSGLDHLEVGEVVRRIIEELKLLAAQHPRLVRWIAVRIALLEFLDRPAAPTELSQSIILLQRASYGVLNRLWQGQREALKEADQLLCAAMEGAAQSAAALLSSAGGQAKLGASLMLRVSSIDSGVAYFGSIGIPAQERHEVASELWSNLPSRPSSHFMVVAATTNEHVGFWVPVVEGDEGHHLPGAPAAFINKQGSAVFKVDIPPLLGFPKALQNRWSAYIASKIQGSFFVSLPLVVPTGAGTTKAVAAIININAETMAGAEWFRACHPEWLAAARDAVAPFALLALTVAQIRLRVLANDVLPPRIDCGSEEWDALPGLPNVGLLQEGSK